MFRQWSVQWKVWSWRATGSQQRRPITFHQCWLDFPRIGKSRRTWRLLGQQCLAASLSTLPFFTEAWTSTQVQIYAQHDIGQCRSYSFAKLSEVSQKSSLSISHWMSYVKVRTQGSSSKTTLRTSEKQLRLRKEISCSLLRSIWRSLKMTKSDCSVISTKWSKYIFCTFFAYVDARKWWNWFDFHSWEHHIIGNVAFTGAPKRPSSKFYRGVCTMS